MSGCQPTAAASSNAN